MHQGFCDSAAPRKTGLERRRGSLAGGKKSRETNCKWKVGSTETPFFVCLRASVGASTRVCTMNHSAPTGVYSEAGLSVSITPVWLSLPGPLSTQSCLNTHTQRQEAPHAKGKKTLYTRPWREYIMGLSGVWGLPVQSNTQTEETQTHAHTRRQISFLPRQLFVFDLR